MLKWGEAYVQDFVTEHNVEELAKLKPGTLTRSSLEKIQIRDIEDKESDIPSSHFRKRKTQEITEFTVAAKLRDIDVRHGAERE